MNDRRLPFGVPLGEQLRSAIDGIDEELAAAPVEPEHAELRAGRIVGHAGTTSVWSFELDEELQVEAESRGRLHVDKRTEATDVRVLATADLSIVLAVEEDLGAAVELASLSFSPNQILVALRTRLDEMLDDEGANLDLIDQLVAPDLGEYQVAEPDQHGPPPSADDEQVQAALRAVEPGLRFTWGPPGTGKTRVLAMAAIEAAERGDRVLVLAHANAAVDVAIARIAELLGDSELLEAGRVLRAGTPHNPELLADAGVLPEDQVARRFPDLISARDRLDAERRRISAELRSVESGSEEEGALARRLLAIRSERDEVRAALKDEARRLTEDARILATTTSRAFIDDRVWGWPATVVIVDESSMVGAAAALAIAGRSGGNQPAETVSFFGDFRQLPPVARSNDEGARHWMGRDAFEFAGVREAYELGKPDARLSILRTQFRMGEQICEVVNGLAYDGLLRTHPTARDRGIRLAELVPEAGTELVLVDAGSLHSACLVDAAPESWSRWDPRSAALALTLAQAIAAAPPVSGGAGTVGVVSPYRAQVGLMAAAARGAAALQVATVHRFQGSECDAVVIDLVDGPDQAGPSRLTGADPETARRLINVAVSRARGKLVVVADRCFIEEHHPLNSPSRELLRLVDDCGGSILDATDVTAGDSRWGSWDEATSKAEAAAAAGKPVELMLPSAAFASGWVHRVIDAAATAGRTLTLRCPPSVLRHLGLLSEAPEHVNISLKVPTSLPFVLTGRQTVRCGGRSTSDAVAELSGPRLVAVTRRLLLVGK